MRFFTILSGVLFASSVLAQTPIPTPIPIPNLPAATSVGQTDLVPFDQLTPGSSTTYTTKRATVGQITQAGVSTNNVRYAGAKCDGLTDDAAALNALFSGLPAYSTIVFPGSSICVYKSPLVLPTQNNITIYGNSATLLYEGASTTANLVT